MRSALRRALVAAREEVAVDPFGVEAKLAADPKATKNLLVAIHPRTALDQSRRDIFGAQQRSGLSGPHPELRAQAAKLLCLALQSARQSRDGGRAVV